MVYELYLPSREDITTIPLLRNTGYDVFHYNGVYLINIGVFLINILAYVSNKDCNHDR